MDTLPPLGEGIPLHSSLKAIDEPPPPLSSIPSRGRAHLIPDDAPDPPLPIRTTTLNDVDVSTLGKLAVGPNDMAGASEISTSNISSYFLSTPPSRPRLDSRSPGPRGVPKLGSMDDSYCDRYRSSSSFGWYDETTAFDSVDVPNSKSSYQIEDWRNLETWDGGRDRRRESLEEAADVQFVVPNARVTTNKTFRHANHGQPEPYAVSIGSTRVRRVSPFAVHAEYQVLMSTKDRTYKSWKRFSDFKLLAEYAKISDLRNSVTAWRHVQQTQRWFRCLEANYLKTKCRLLEKFLAQLLFEVPTPSLLMNFVGAQQPGLVLRR